jgi:hypothetical protein
MDVLSSVALEIRAYPMTRLGTCSAVMRVTVYLSEAAFRSITPVPDGMIHRT